VPIIDSKFRPAYGLSNGHVQTIIPALLPIRRPSGIRRERFMLSDSDYLDLDWLMKGSPRLAILSHGLEGSSEAVYIYRMMRHLSANGWDVLAWNFRGCSGELNLLPRSYHSGESADLREVIDHAALQYKSVALIGFSLGGNITLKYLGEQTPHPSVRVAIAVSAPVDLASSAQALDQQAGNRLYLRRFIRSLTTKIENKASKFPAEFDLQGLHHIKTFYEFDNRYTAPLHGFMDAEDYWAKASSLPLLANISVPALLLNCRNDPFLSPACFPQDGILNNLLFSVEYPDSGGHLGFIDKQLKLNWLPKRVLAFMEDQLQG